MIKIIAVVVTVALANVKAAVSNGGDQVSTGCG